jgi:hypothetical protein
MSTEKSQHQIHLDVIQSFLDEFADLEKREGNAWSELIVTTIAKYLVDVSDLIVNVSAQNNSQFSKRDVSDCSYQALKKIVFLIELGMKNSEEQEDGN